MITALLQGWDGNFGEDSSQGTLYTHAHMRFYSKLFALYESDLDERLAMSDGYAFYDFWRLMIADVKKNGAESRYQKLCQGAYPEYEGKNYCELNVAKSFIEAKQFLTENTSPDPKKWRWIDHHTNEYTNLPWSRTPLRFLFHKSIPVVGNTNTPNVSKTGFTKNWGRKVLQSGHAANYKQVFTMNKKGDPDTNLYSIDTGVGGNPLRGNYFD